MTRPGGGDPTVTQAFELLGLAPGATPDAIQDRFRELAPEVHPDVPGGDEESFKRLEAARRVALAAHHSTALVPLDQVTELIRAATGGLAERTERQERANQATRFVGGLVRAHTSKLKRVQRTAGITAAIAGLTAAVLQYIKTKGAFYGDYYDYDYIPNGLSIALTIPFVYCGFRAWIGRERGIAIAGALEDIAETFDDRSTIVDAVYEIEDESEIERPWTRDMLIRAVAKWAHLDRNGSGTSDGLSRLWWLPLRRRRRFLRDPFGLRELRLSRAASRDLRSLAWVIGPDDFARLLLTKGLEHGVISEREVIDGERLYLLYDVQLKRD
jgi:hypothetical protein